MKLEGESSKLGTFLRRFGQAPRGAPAALLLHGGEVKGDMFCQPDGGLVRYLLEQGFDVWVLEWRASPHVVDALLKQPPLGGSALAECRLFTLDEVVEGELPAALRIVNQEMSGADLSVMGHCLGSGVVAIAIARGVLESFPITNVVLSTLGLFVEVPWRGWIKAEDFLLERLLQGNPTCREIDPRDFNGWPEEMKVAFRHWPDAWLPAGGSPPRQFLRRLSFMVGQPYSIERLHPSLRGNAAQTFFGPLHLGLYLHACQMVRRGFAARFDVLDILDRPRIHGRRSPNRLAFSSDVVGDLVSKHFKTKRITLLAAGSNHLWHRESIDLMYDWLRSIEGTSRSCFTKQVFRDYNLQELLWGEDAWDDVFPAIAEGLRPRGVSRARRTA